MVKRINRGPRRTVGSRLSTLLQFVDGVHLSCRLGTGTYCKSLFFLSLHQLPKLRVAGSSPVSRSTWVSETNHESRSNFGATILIHG